MNSSKIEVGDVFTHTATGAKEYVAKRIDKYDRIWTTDVQWVEEGNCRLVRKAAKEHYAGLTLPTPPAGYRLAKWGEELPNGAMWFGPMSNSWVPPVESKIEAGLAYNELRPNWSIYAIPGESALPKTWQFSEENWVVPQPKTLADVPDGVAIVAFHSGIAATGVVQRDGKWAVHWKGGKSKHAPSEFTFIRYLDPQPATPPTLDDVPDGRVIQFTSESAYCWKHGGRIYRQHSGGLIRPMDSEDSMGLGFTVTDYIAEFK